MILVVCLTIGLVFDTAISQVPVTKNVSIVENTETTLDDDLKEAFHHNKTLDIVKQEIKNADGYGPFAKRVLIRKLRRNTVAVNVTDKVTSMAMVAGYIQVEINTEGEVVSQIDWEGLTNFVKEILPLIIEIIKMFGTIIISITNFMGSIVITIFVV